MGIRFEKWLYKVEGSCVYIETATYDKIDKGKRRKLKETEVLRCETYIYIVYISFL